MELKQNRLSNHRDHNEVVVVDEKDKAIGSMDILAAHQGDGVLHRAISVLLYRKTDRGIELLLQKRSRKKPLWPLFWTNTMCTHPRDGEPYEDSAVRRLREEMGIDYRQEHLLFVFQLLYHARYNLTLSERELDRVYVGQWDGTPHLNPDEAADSLWEEWKEVVSDIKKKPEKYTPWFKQLLANENLQKAVHAVTS